MKKINSIGYGPTILIFGMIFILLIPLLFYFLNTVFVLEHFFLKIIKISVGMGLLTLLFLTVLLIIELQQDKRVNEFYEMNKNRKIRISDDYYECQNCGNKKVRENDESCPVCGIKLTSLE